MLTMDDSEALVCMPVLTWYAVVCRWLYSNQLKKLPPQIGKMSQLRKLWLDGNQLTQLPDELGDCTALQVGGRVYSFRRTQTAVQTVS